MMATLPPDVIQVPMRSSSQWGKGSVYRVSDSEFFWVAEVAVGAGETVALTFDTDFVVGDS